jgi:hypothetical protein
VPLPSLKFPFQTASAERTAIVPPLLAHQNIVATVPQNGDGCHKKMFNVGAFGRGAWLFLVDIMDDVPTSLDAAQLVGPTSMSSTAPQNPEKSIRLRRALG